MGSGSKRMDLESPNDEEAGGQEHGLRRRRVGETQVEPVADPGQQDMNVNEEEQEKFIIFGEELVYLEGTETVELEKGTSVDLMLLLGRSERDYLVRKDGTHVDIESLKGKYVMVCCYLVPMESGGLDERWGKDSFIQIHSDLLARGRTDFELVMVAKMKPGYEDCFRSFDDFFSDFSDSCLSIPFSDAHSRDVACKSVGLSMTGFFTNSAVVILDPDHKVVQLNDPYLTIAWRGADCFPFTDDTLESVTNELTLMSQRVNYLDAAESIEPPTFMEIVKGKPSDVLHSLAGDCQTTISELSKKNVVGLYICEKGDFVDKLCDLHQQCLHQNKDFEIVFACLPNSLGIWPSIKTSLIERGVSWWVLPFSLHISERLSILSENDDEDALMIIGHGHGGKFVERAAKILVTGFGVAAYPFTRETIMEKKLETLRSLTLEALLSGQQNDLVRSNNTEVHLPVSYLRNKTILLYLDPMPISLPQTLSTYHNLIKDSYPELMREDPDFEVVFVSEDTEKDYQLSELHMPWLVFPSDPTPVLEQLFWRPWICSPTLVAFGKDGKIKSLMAETYFSTGDNQFKFPGDLREEVYDFTKSMMFSLIYV